MSYTPLSSPRREELFRFLNSIFNLYPSDEGKVNKFIDQQIQELTVNKYGDQYAADCLRIMLDFIRTPGSGEKRAIARIKLLDEIINSLRDKLGFKNFQDFLNSLATEANANPARQTGLSNCKEYFTKAMQEPMGSVFKNEKGDSTKTERISLSDSPIKGRKEQQTRLASFFESYTSTYVVNNPQHTATSAKEKEQVKETLRKHAEKTPELKETDATERTQPTTPTKPRSSSVPLPHSDSGDATNHRSYSATDISALLSNPTTEQEGYFTKLAQEYYNNRNSTQGNTKLREIFGLTPEQIFQFVPYLTEASNLDYGCVEQVINKYIANYEGIHGEGTTPQPILDLALQINGMVTASKKEKSDAEGEQRPLNEVMTPEKLAKTCKIEVFQKDSKDSTVRQNILKLEQKDFLAFLLAKDEVTENKPETYAHIIKAYFDKNQELAIHHEILAIAAKPENRIILLREILNTNNKSLSQLRKHLLQASTSQEIAGLLVIPNTDVIGEKQQTIQKHVALLVKELTNAQKINYTVSLFKQILAAADKPNELQTYEAQELSSHLTETEKKEVFIGLIKSSEKDILAIARKLHSYGYDCVTINHEATNKYISKNPEALQVGEDSFDKAYCASFYMKNIQQQIQSQYIAITQNKQLRPFANQKLVKQSFAIHVKQEISALSTNKLSAALAMELYIAAADAERQNLLAQLKSPGWDFSKTTDLTPKLCTVFFGLIQKNHDMLNILNTFKQNNILETFWNNLAPSQKTFIFSSLLNLNGKQLSDHQALLQGILNAEIKSNPTSTLNGLLTIHNIRNFCTFVTSIAKNATYDAIRPACINAALQFAGQLIAEAKATTDSQHAKHLKQTAEDIFHIIEFNYPKDKAIKENKKTSKLFSDSFLGLGLGYKIKQFVMPFYKRFELFNSLESIIQNADLMADLKNAFHAYDKTDVVDSTGQIYQAVNSSPPPKELPAPETQTDANKATEGQKENPGPKPGYMRTVKAQTMQPTITDDISSQHTTYNNSF